MTAFRSKPRGTDRSVDLILPEPAPTRGAAVLRRRFDVVDAQFVVLPLASQTWDRRVRNDNRRPVTQPVKELAPWLRRSIGLGVGAFKLTERFLQWLPARGFAAVIALTFLAVFSLSGGLSALRAAFAAPVAPSLAITEVTKRIEDQNGMKVLAVYGTVENGASESRVTPGISVDIIASGRVTTQRVTTFDAPLPAGGQESFVLRVPYSGSKMPEVAVSFEAAGAPAE